MNLKHCLNWKVAAGLGVIALGILVVAPNLVGRIFPILLVAICPLSMLAMMVGMGSIRGNKDVDRRTLSDGNPEREDLISTSANAAPCRDAVVHLGRRRAAVPEIATFDARAPSPATQQQELIREIARSKTEDPAKEPVFYD
jgi:hypothetical protein